MHKKTTMAGIIILLAAAFLLAACTGSNAPASPTGDANAVYTQAAATVSAGLTATAQKNPAATETQAPPTDTPTNVPLPPTATVAQPGPGNATVTGTQKAGTNPPAQATATLKPGTTQQAQTPTPTKSGGIVPTATKGAVAPPPTTGDKAVWVSQSPADGTKIQKSATFTMTYVLKNTGTTTWTKGYTLRIFSSDNRFGSPADTNLLGNVAPGESVTILFTLIAPDTVGKASSVWVMTNEAGGNFYSVSLEMDVTE